MDHSSGRGLRRVLALGEAIMSAHVWIATGNQLLCIEPATPQDADIARAYMHDAYNPWLQRRDPSNFINFWGLSVKAKDGNRYALQVDRRAITKIDQRENGFAQVKPRIYSYFLAPEGHINVKPATDDARPRNRKRGRPIGS